MENNKRDYLEGLKGGVPIALGYLSISFGFGITAVGQGVKALYALLISMTNLTSAGQLAGLGIIVAAGTLVEMVLTQLVINLRYSLMGISLSQNLSDDYSVFHRFLSSFFITDEIFAVAVVRRTPVTPAYMYGLATLPYFGWSLGTILGAVAGNLLPGNVTSALGIALYGMFCAIIVSPSKKDKGVCLAVLCAAALSLVIRYVPVFGFITPGFAIIICSVISAVIAALVRPVDESPEDDD